MATFNIYQNILLKLESIYLKLEVEIDNEIVLLTSEEEKLASKLEKYKNKVEVLNSLKRTFDLYDNQDSELLQQSLFSTLSQKQIDLRLLQEKELLLKGYLIPTPDMKLPTVIQINKEYKVRKKLQEIELLAIFIMENEGLEQFRTQIENANIIYDNAIESGAIDKLENAISVFQNIFEKITKLSQLTPLVLEEFKNFRELILLQATQTTPFTPQDVVSDENLHACYQTVRENRINLEIEVDKLLYQFSMFQNGKQHLALEIKEVSGELESIIFKEYSVKQKIQELRQQKFDLNHQKENFLKNPTLNNYSEAMKELDMIENRFHRVIVHKAFDKHTLISQFFSATKNKAENMSNEETRPYQKSLFQVLHNNNITSKEKLTILRLAKQSQLIINSHSGKFFLERSGKHQPSSAPETGRQHFQLELH